MRFAALLLATTVLATTIPGGAAAQERVFIQIEALPSLEEATERARAYGDLVGNVNGFSLGGRWFGLAIGPFEAAEARRVLRQLRRDGLIPRDSYVTEGDTYRDQFWPNRAGAVAGSAPDAGGEQVAAVTETPAAPAAETPVIEAPVEAEAPVVEPEETRREAQRSESLLTSEEKMDLQRAMQWFGFYTAGIDGSFGRGTRSSMSAYQTDRGLEATGVLTTRQRARLLQEYADAQAELGLEPLTVAEAGIEMTAPLGLVEFDRIEAPFVHYLPRDGSDVRLSLISQPGDRSALGGLYEILQTLEVIPTEGPRAKSRDSFEITGVEPDRTTQVSAKLIDGHIVGYILSWPQAQDALAARALPEMERTLASVGAPLPSDAGFEASEQSFDMVSGLEVRQPLRSASGFFVNSSGAVVTAADTVASCGRITLDRLHEAEVAEVAGGVAVLRPTGRLAPVEVAVLAPSEGRLRAPVSVSGFPFGGVLGAATLSFGTLEDVRGLDGSADVLRLSLEAREGDVGGPVFDDAGRVAGMLLPDPMDGSRTLPPDVTFAVKSTSLQTILTEAGVQVATSASGAPIAPEDLTTKATGMTVLVSCWE